DEQGGSCVRHLPHDRYSSGGGAGKGREGRLRLKKAGFFCPAFNVSDLSDSMAAYGKTPMMRAPMNANAAQSTSALSGRVSPISKSLLCRLKPGFYDLMTDCQGFCLLHRGGPVKPDAPQSRFVVEISPQMR